MTTRSIFSYEKQNVKFTQNSRQYFYEKQKLKITSDLQYKTLYA